MARSITDEEISFIKAMQDRGIRNRDIQFYFNTQERPVNTGRISQIGNGSYGPEVEPATQQELNNFLDSFQAQPIGVGVAARAPTTGERARQKFHQADNGEWFLSEGETSEQECKVDFDPRRLNPIIKAIAALANNKGGYIFIGVQNGDFKVVGLNGDTFSDTDVVRISDKVKTFLVPTPEFRKGEISLGDHTVGFIYVEKHSEPPVMVCRDGDGLEDGSILFRYPGQSSKIKFGDLHAMLRYRDRVSQEHLIRSASRISEIGTDASFILDTRAGTLESGDTRFTIDSKLADQLSFIREGEFEEVVGAPALRLVGDVKAVGQGGEIVSRIESRALAAEEVLAVFLSRSSVRNPLDYIRLSLLVQRQWLPVFYFAKLSEKTLADIVQEVSEINANYELSKSRVLERLRGERHAYQAASGQALPVFARIAAQRDMDDLELEYDDATISRALLALPDNFRPLEPIFELIERMFQRAEARQQWGPIFKAAARLDEVAYAGEVQ